MLFERQQYQEDCVSNIISVLNKTDGRLDASLSQLTKLQSEKNIREKKQNNTYRNRLDVLMETGTGKTFTYLKTMYELNRQFGKNKFIVFVPRVAIRAVVAQNIDLTSDYFFQEYGKRIKKHIYGDTGDLSQVMDYIRNENELSVLILTSASITSKNKNDRILTSRNERMLFEDKSPLDAISKLQPVIVIDEPHLMQGKGFTAAYHDYFSASVCLRFGATYPSDEDARLSNVVYELDSITSFREYLVKKIGVTTVQDGANSIKFYRIPGARNQQARLVYFRNGIEYERVVNLNQNIAAITEEPDNNFHIVKMAQDDIYLSNGTRRRFSTDDYVLAESSIRLMIRKTIEIHFEKEEQLFNQNIKTLSLFFIPAIADFRGEAPRVKQIFDEEYQQQRKSVLQKLQEAPNQAYQEYLQRDYDNEGNLCVREGYFSGDKGAADKKELYGVNLILNDKSKLLSTAEPLRFIFSVWALQEGWDNPNIFNICKLAATGKETSRRQQVGRGLRLAVNNEGRRQTLRYFQSSEEEFYRTNMLDVIVSGQEKGFIEGIQEEIIGDTINDKRMTREMLLKIGLNQRQVDKLLSFLDDHGVICFCDETASGHYEIVELISDFLRQNKDILPPALTNVYDILIKVFSQPAPSLVENRNKPTDKVAIHPALFKQFEELWKTITRRAKIVYRDIDDDNLIKQVAEAFARESIDPLRTRITRQIYNHHKNRIENMHEDVISYETSASADMVSDDAAKQSAISYDPIKFITDFSGKENLPLSFCLKLFNNLDKEKIKSNPHRAREVLSFYLKDSVHQTIVQGIEYQLDSDINISARRLFYKDAECQKPKEEIEASALGRYSAEHPDLYGNYLYDKIIYDSQIEKTAATEQNNSITVFAKLPKISIPTPYMSYNPDFAYYIQGTNGNKLYLIVETKGYDFEAEIPDDEKLKIAYAKKFFARLNEKTPEAKIVYKQRINRQTLADILEDIRRDG